MKLSRRTIIKIALFAAVFLVFAAGFTYIDYIKTTVTFNVYFFDTPLSGLSPKQTVSLVEREYNEKIENAVIKLDVNGKEAELPLKELDIRFDGEEISKSAMALHHSLNPLGAAAKARKDVTAPVKFDEEKLFGEIGRISESLGQTLVNPSYKTENDTLIIENGKSGIAIDAEDLKSRILSCVNAMKFEMLTANLVYSDFTPINIDDIYEKVRVNAQNAALETSGGTTRVKDSVIGVSFNLEAARAMLGEQKEQYVIPLTYTSPDVTRDTVGSDGFVHMLSATSTSMSNSSSGRLTNVKLAAAVINGMVLNPGETFSFCGVVGDTTPDKGYKLATVYTQSGTDQGYGGGICQVSSTLYTTCLLADMKIIERRNHSYIVSYLPLGQDAAISYGSQDLKFQNNKSYPVRIYAAVENAQLKVELHATEPLGMEITLKSVKTGSVPRSNVDKPTSSLAAGVRKVESNGSDGASCELYQIIKVDGAEISNLLVNKSTYRALNKVTLVGI